MNLLTLPLWVSDVDSSVRSVVANRDVSQKIKKRMTKSVDPEEPSHLHLHCLQSCLVWFTSLKELTESCIMSHNGIYANSVDPDQTPQNAAPDQHLHGLHER